MQCSRIGWNHGLFNTTAQRGVELLRARPGAGKAKGRRKTGALRNDLAWKDQTFSADIASSTETDTPGPMVELRLIFFM